MRQGERKGEAGREREVVRKRWRNKERGKCRDKEGGEKEGDGREREHHQLEPSILTSESMGDSLIIETTADTFVPCPVLQ